MILARNSARSLFAVSGFTIYTAIFFITRTHHASIVNVAAAFDLTFTTCAVFYFLLVRHGYAGWLTLASVAFAGIRASMFLVPEAPQMKWLAAPLELLLIVNIVRRIGRIEGGDALTRIRTATRAVITNARVAQIAAAEVAVGYYALFSWRARREPGFSSAKTSGYSLFGTLLILAMVFEGIPLHLIVMRYSPAMAWTISALDVYGLLWAVALLRANTLRSTRIDADYLRIRVGLIWGDRYPSPEGRVHSPFHCPRSTRSKRRLPQHASVPDRTYLSRASNGPLREPSNGRQHRLLVRRPRRLSAGELESSSIAARLSTFLRNPRNFPRLRSS
jgi:hypothetical protein